MSDYNFLKVIFDAVEGLFNPQTQMMAPPPLKGPQFAKPPIKPEFKPGCTATPKHCA